MRYIYLFLILVASSSTSLSQDILWQRIYGGPRFDRGNSVVATADGGFLTAGISQGLEGESMVMRGYLLKIMADGVLQWEKRLSDSAQSIPHAIFAMADGGYIVFGNAVHPANPSVNSPYAAIIAEDGTVLREKRYGDINSNQSMDIVSRTADSGFIAAGSNDAGIMLWRFDRSGDLLWDHLYRVPLHRGFAVEQMADGGYTVTGSAGNSGTGYNSILLRTTATGDSLWLREFSGSSDTIYSEYGEAVFEIEGGDLLVVGHTSEGGRMIYVAALSADGTVRSSRRIGFPAYFHNIVNVRRSSEAGFLIVGNASFQSSGHNQIYLAQLDRSGELRWEFKHGPELPNDTTYQGSDVIESGENEYLVVGARAIGSPTGTMWDAMAMKVHYMLSAVAGEKRVAERMDLR